MTTLVQTTTSRPATERPEAKKPITEPAAEQQLVWGLLEHPEALGDVERTGLTAADLFAFAPVIEPSTRRSCASSPTGSR